MADRIEAAPPPDPARQAASAHRVVIVGAGFGGLAAAQALARTSARVTVIDRTNHNLFQPLLYQVATAALGSEDIALPVRSLFRNDANVDVLMAELTGIDRAKRLVLLEGAEPVPYDSLILATGSVYSWFGHEEWSARAPALKTLSDALSLRARLLDAFERAETCADAAEARRLLTFVVVGAGPTGVELASSIAELAHHTLARDFRHIRPSEARIVLCDAGTAVLSGFPSRLSNYAGERLERLGIELRLGAAVERIDERGVVAGGQRIEAECVFWAAGIAATPVARWLGTDGVGRGKQVATASDCSLPDDPSIFVIGDAATQPGPDGTPLPGLGSVAKQQGHHVGRLIAARLRGRTGPPAQFRYRNWGQLAILGSNSAIADFGRVRLTGRLAWLLWSAVHLMLLVSARNRVVVYVNWVWAWLTYGRGARIFTRVVPGIPRGAPAGRSS